MPPISDLHQLKTMEYRKAALFLMQEFRMNRPDDMPRLYAAAYAVLKIRQGADAVSLDTFLMTESDPEIAAFLDSSLRGKWDAVVRSQNAFDDDLFAAFLLYDNTYAAKRQNMETPECIAQLAIALLQIEAGQNVADFCTGRGAFLRECTASARAGTLYGSEIHAADRVIARMRAAILPNTHIAEEDVLQIPADRHRFDRIFSNYPFGLRIGDVHDSKNTALQYLNKHLPVVRKNLSAEWMYNAAILNCLAENGRAAAIMSNGSTWNASDREARKFFTDSGLIEAAISLPANLFEHTAIPTTMIVMSHGNTCTHFVDATDCFTKNRRHSTITAEQIAEIAEAAKKTGSRSIVLTREEIAAQDYLLNAQRLIEERAAEQAENSVPLGSVIHRMTRGAQLKAAELEALASPIETPYHFLMLSDIQNGLIRSRSSCLTGIERRLEKYCVRDKSLVIAKNGTPIKTAVAEVAEGEMLLANGNLYVIELDESKIEPYFLKAWLDSPQGAAALKSLCVGAVIPNIPMEALRNLPVPLPDLRVQKRIAEKYCETVQKLRKKQRELDALMQELMQVYDMD